MIDIYDYNGVKLTYSSVLSDLPITEACEHVEELMKSDYVALSWKDSQYYVLPVGAYIIYEDTAFLLLEPYTPEQKSEEEWEYKPQFQHPKMYLGKVPFSRPTKDSDANDIDLIDWPYTGGISTLLEYFREAIETALGLEPNSFMYEIVGEIDSIVSATFSNVDILSALSNVANVLNCEWHIDLEQMTLYFGHIMIDHSEVEDTILEVGQNIGIPSVRSSKEGFWNAFEPQGSTRNITRRAASGEYVQANVRLALDRDTYYHLNDEDYPQGIKTPEGIIYTDESGRVIDRLPTNQKAYIKSLIFEDIFPKLDLYAYDVRCRERYLLDDQGQKVIDHYEGMTPVYKRYAVWYMQLAYPLYNPDKSVREWVNYNIKDVRDLTSTVVSIGTNHSDYTSFVLDMAFASHYFNNRSVSYPGSEEYPNYIVRIQAHDITIKGYITKDAATGNCSFYSESSDPQGDDRDEPDAAALRAFSDAIEEGDEILFVSGVNASAFPAKYSQIIDGKELYCQFSVNKKSGAETTPLAGRGEGDDGNYGFALYYHEDSEIIPPVETEGDTGVDIKKGDYEIVFQQQNDYILPTTYAQGLIPKGVKVDGHEVTSLNDLSDKSDGLKGNIVNLYNIVMDATYEASAQNDLANETLKYIKNLFTDNNSYTFKTEEVAFKKAMDIHLAHSLYIGKRVIYKNGDYELTTRVMKIVTKVDFKFQQEITVGNEVIKGAQTQLKEQVQTLISAGGGDGSGQISEAAIKKVINNYVAARFISKVNDDTAQGNVGFLGGIWLGIKRWFIDALGNASLNTLELASLLKANEIQSSNYTGEGIADTGFRLTADDNTGSSKLVVDNLYVRKKATFEELEVKKITAIAGNQIYSSAANVILRTDYYDGEGNQMGYSITKVPWLLKKVPFLLRGRFFGRLRKTRIFIEDEDIEKIRKVRCYFLAKDEDREVYNLWKVQEFRDGQPIAGTGNDFARCQTMNITNSHRPTYLRGMETKAGNVYWWRRLCGVSSDPVSLPDGREYHYFDVEFNYAEEERLRQQGKRCAWCDLSSGDIPAAGDNVVQFGNDMNTDRMNLIAVEVNGDDAPAHKWYRGIYTFDLTKCWWGGNPRKEMISAASGVEFYASHYKLKTDYGVAKIPMDRPEVNWSDIAMQRDDYSPYELVRKLYYYDSVTHNGSRWLCFASDGQHWVRPQVWDDPTYAVQDANGNYRHNGNRISDTDYYQLTIEQKEQCIRVSDYTTAEPSSLSGDWKQIVYKGDNSVRIDLDNENDAMLYSSSKGLISGNVVSNAYLYDGINDVSTSATWSINAIGCTATITNRVITVTAMSASVGSVTVSAVYNGFTYTAILSLKKILDADKYELIVTPNSIAYNNTTDTPATSVLSIQVFKTACDGTRSLSAPPSGYNVYAGSTQLAASSTGTYSYTTDNSAVNSVVIKISTSTSSTDCLDSETIPVNKTANGAKGDDGYTPRKGVDYFDGQNGKDGWMVTADPANVIITQSLGISSTSFSSQAVTFSSMKGNVSATIYSIGTPTWYHFTGSKSGNTITVTSPTSDGNSYYTEGYFLVTVNVTDPDTGSVVAFSNIKVPCYANLLGTWKESVAADVKHEVATAKFYFEDEYGNVVAHETIGDYIKSSSENISKLEATTESRNMLDCASGDGWRNWNGDSDADYNDATQMVGSTTGNVIDVYSKAVFLKAGVQYVVSVYAPSQPALKLFELNGNPNAKVAQFSGNHAEQLSVSQASGSYGGCNRYYGTVTLSASDGDDYYVLDVYSGIRYFYRPQIEVGSTPTSWVPGKTNSTSQIKQTAYQIEAKVNDTGVNIEDGTITLSADKTTISGELSVPRVQNQNENMVTTCEAGVVRVESKTTASYGVFTINSLGEVVLQMYDKDGKLVLNLGGTPNTVVNGRWRAVRMKRVDVNGFIAETRENFTATAHNTTTFYILELGTLENSGQTIQYFLPNGNQTTNQTVIARDNHYFVDDYNTEQTIANGTFIPDGYYVLQNDGIFPQDAPTLYEEDAKYFVMVKEFSSGVQVSIQAYHFD